MLISIILDVCIVSHLERCRCVSFYELIIGCSIFEKIDSLRVSFLSVIGLDGVLRARHRNKDCDRVNVLMKWNLDREDRVSLCSLCLLT